MVAFSLATAALASVLIISRRVYECLYSNAISLFHLGTTLLAP